MFYVFLGFFGILGAAVMVKFKSRLLALATSLFGALGVTFGLAVLLAHVDARFLWVLNVGAARDHLSSPFVWGSALFILTAFICGLAFQLHDRKRRHHKLLYRDRAERLLDA